MSGGHWEYLKTQLDERAGQPLNDVWRLLGQIEHELDWGISCDTCYDCAKIRVIDALEAYFDTGATSIENAMHVLYGSEDECQRCKARKTPMLQSPETAIIKVFQEGKVYKGVVRVVEDER